MNDRDLKTILVTRSAEVELVGTAHPTSLNLLKLSWWALPTLHLDLAVNCQLSTVN